MIYINSSSTKPIYEQITEQLKNAILTGQLKEGAALPSIRQLAKELKVSVITTKRAYTDLEYEGLIETYPGKGSYVSFQSEENLRRQLAFALAEQVEQVVTLAKNAQLPFEDVVSILQTKWSEK